MINLQGIINPAVNEYRATSIANAMKRPNIGLIQATQLSGKLLMNGVLDIAQGTVMCGAKLTGAYLLTLTEQTCALFEKNCDFKTNAWTSHYSLSESLEEVAKVVKTTLLLPTAFVGPFKPQWVARCSEMLGVTPERVSLQKRILDLVLSIALPIGGVCVVVGAVQGNKAALLAIQVTAVILLAVTRLIIAIIENIPRLLFGGGF